MTPKLKCVRDKHTKKVYCIDIETGELTLYRQPEHIEYRDCPDCIIRALFLQKETSAEVDYEVLK